MASLSSQERARRIARLLAIAAVRAAQGDKTNQKPVKTKDKKMTTQNSKTHDADDRGSPPADAVFLDQEQVLMRTGLSVSELHGLLLDEQFPTPITHHGDWPTWQWTDIAAWLTDEGKGAGDE